MTAYVFFATTRKGGFLSNGTVTAKDASAAREAVIKSLGRSWANTEVALAR